MRSSPCWGMRRDRDVSRAEMVPPGAARSPARRLTTPASHKRLAAVPDLLKLLASRQQLIETAAVRDAPLAHHEDVIGAA